MQGFSYFLYKIGAGSKKPGLPPASACKKESPAAGCPAQGAPRPARVGPAYIMYSTVFSAVSLVCSLKSSTASRSSTGPKE